VADKVKSYEYVGTGTVVKGVDPDDQYSFIDVYLAELVPVTDIQVDSTNSKNSVNVDAFGKHTAILGGSRDIITAKWLPDDSRSLMSPLVVKGETVKIYRFGDGDTYVWKTMYNEVGDRTKDRFMFFLSNKNTETLPDNKVNKVGDGYRFHFSSLSKIVELFTSKNDKEPSEYYLGINTKQAAAIIKDSLNNAIELLSTNGWLSISISKLIKIATSVIDVKAKDSITSSTKTYNTKSETYNNESSVYSVKTTSYNVSAESLNIVSNNEDLVSIIDDLNDIVGGMINIDSLNGNTKVHPDTVAKVSALRTRIGKLKS
jgi:hypothetical protein